MRTPRQLRGRDRRKTGPRNQQSEVPSYLPGTPSMLRPPPMRRRPPPPPWPPPRTSTAFLSWRRHGPATLLGFYTSPADPTTRPAITAPSSGPSCAGRPALFPLLPLRHFLLCLSWTIPQRVNEIFKDTTVGRSCLLCRSCMHCLCTVSSALCPPVPCLSRRLPHLRASSPALQPGSISPCDTVFFFHE